MIDFLYFLLYFIYGTLERFLYRLAFHSSGNDSSLINSSSTAFTVLGSRYFGARRRCRLAPPLTHRRRRCRRRRRRWRRRRRPTPWVRVAWRVWRAWRLAASGRVRVCDRRRRCARVRRRPARCRPRRSRSANEVRWSGFLLFFYLYLLKPTSWLH